MRTRELTPDMPADVRRAMRCQAGFSIGEVSLVIAIIGTLSVLSTPMFVSYYQAASLQVAAEQVATLLNQGRQIGIKENVGVCVRNTSTALRYHIGDCGGAAWTGAGTDSSGNIALPRGFTLATTANPIFSYLGAASPMATYTVTNAQTGATLRVFVATSGRVTIGP